MIYKFKCNCGALRHTDNKLHNFCGFCGEKSKLVEEYGAKQIAVFEDEPADKKEPIKKIASKSASVCGRSKPAIPNSKSVVSTQGKRIIKGVVNDKAVFDAGNN